MSEEELIPSTYRIVPVATSLSPEDLIMPPALEEGERRVTCLKNTRITHPDHFQDVRHFIFGTDPEEDIKEGLAGDSSPLTYNPGDVMNIQPENLPENVNGLLDLLGWADKADEPMDIQPREPGKYRIPFPGSIDSGGIPW